MVGNLYLPTSYKAGDKLPAVVVAGAWTTVKEQMPELYAKRLVEQGFATLTFDFRLWGESGGELREYESPQKKIEDIKNAVTYLRSLPMIDANRIGGLGVCASAGYMAQAIAAAPKLNIPPYLFTATTRLYQRACVNFTMTCRDKRSCSGHRVSTLTSTTKSRMLPKRCKLLLLTSKIRYKMLQFPINNRKP